jgi:hypothetical protein
MNLAKRFHLGYSTNIHRGETWTEVFAALNQFTLAVRDRVCPGKPFGIGLRLSDQAASDLSQPAELAKFLTWLREKNCYVYTVNAFPFGRFHGTRVKEQVYLPDWTSRQRLDYTRRVFAILAELLPEGIEGSVSTVPCSYKEFITSDEQKRAIRQNLWDCVEYIDQLSRESGKPLHLGLEPEPLCYLETSSETVRFFDEMRSERPGDTRLDRCLGVNYDTCHLAVEYERAEDVISRFVRNGIKVSKLHLSSALRLQPTPQRCQFLQQFADDIYFHQVIARSGDGALRRYRDLDIALKESSAGSAPHDLEWRIHFHIPLHSQPSDQFENTSDHILSVMDYLKGHPEFCSHLEMETYTWEVLPSALKQRSVVDQLVSEYAWCLKELAIRGISAEPAANPAS